MSGKFVDVTLRLIDKMTSPLNAAGAKLKDSARQWERAGKQIQNAGKSITAVGASITTAVTVPIVGAGAAAIKVAADFEEGMSGVQAICGATGDELTALAEKAQEMGAKTKFSATEATDAFKYMAMAGWNASEMTAGIEGIMYLAGATGEDLAQTSDIVTDALTAFGLTADDTSMFVDVLAQAANRSNTDVSMLGESFKYVAPVAGAMKYNVQDISVALGLMANNGVKASTAGTSLRSWISRMAAPTKAVTTAMSELGISMEDSEGKTKDFATIMQETRDAFAGLTEAQKSQYASTLAGKSGMSGLLAIVNSSDKDFADLTSAIYDADGACKQMYDTAQNNLTGQLTILKSTVESIGIAFGNKLLPYIKSGTEWLQNMADKFNALTDGQQDTIIKIALVAAAVGPAVLAFGKMVTVVGKVVSVVGKIGKAFRTFGSVAGLLTSPVGIAIGVIAGLIAVGVLLYKNWDKVKEMAAKVFDFVKKTLNSVGVSAESLKERLAPIKEKFEEIKENVKALWETVKPYLNKFGSEAGGKLKSVAEGAIKAFGSLIKTATTIVQNAAIAFNGLIEFVTGVFTGDWRKTWEGVKDIFKGTFKGLASWIKAPLDALITAFGGSTEEIGNKIKSAVKKVREYAKSVSNAVGLSVQSLKKKLSPIIENVKEIGINVKQLWSIISTYLKKFTDAATKRFGKIGTEAKSLWETIRPYIKKIGELAAAVFKGKIGAAVGAAVGFFGSMLNTITTVAGSITYVFNGLLKFITGVFTGDWRKAWEGVKDIFGGAFSALTALAKAPLNAVIGLINGAIAGINNIGITIPEWVPGLGGKDFSINIPTIPQLAKGTMNWQGGPVQVHERGGEIIDLPSGSRVYPHDKSVQMAYNAGASSRWSFRLDKLADQIVIREESDIKKIVTQLADMLEEASKNIGGDIDGNIPVLG